MCSQFPTHSDIDFMIPAGPVLPMKFRSVKSAASAGNEKKMAAHAGGGSWTGQIGFGTLLSSNMAMEHPRAEWRF